MSVTMETEAETVDGPVAQSKLFGERVEVQVVSETPEVRAVPDSAVEWYDAVFVERVSAAADLRFAGVLSVSTGTPVEIKSAAETLASGSRGRFYFRREQHSRLVENGGVYALAVRDAADEVLAVRFVSTTVVDALLDGMEWRDPGRSESPYLQAAWTGVFAPGGVGDE